MHRRHVSFPRGILLTSAAGDITTSKVLRCDEHTSERNNHGHNSNNHINPAADRRFASLAP
jgi:hypothetical protein